MRIFSPFYHRIMCWAKHRHASYYLAGLSFTESTVFPIPPDVMLAPMALASPDRAWRYAMVATTASTLGGVVGYLLGFFFFHLVYGYIRQLGYAPLYADVQHAFQTQGFWILFVAGFAPIPYKLFTIAGGAAQMPLLPFIIASFIGRGLRFYTVAGLMRWGGERMERKIRYCIDVIGWVVLALLLLVYIIWRVRIMTFL